MHPPDCNCPACFDPRKKSDDLLKRLDELKLAEDAFFARHGFPGYQTTDINGNACAAHRNWVRAVEKEREFSGTNIIGSPLARKMFVLGYLKAMEAIK